MFSCEYYELFKNTYFDKYIRWLLVNNSLFFVCRAEVYLESCK